MPLAPLQSRYRPQMPWTLPGALSPDDEQQDGAFNPRMESPTIEDGEQQQVEQFHPKPPQEPMPPPAPMEAKVSMPPPGSEEMGPESDPREIATHDKPEKPHAEPTPVDDSEAAVAAEATPSTAKPKSPRDAALAKTQQFSTPTTQHSNWAQRLGMALLSTTKLAPYANQIVHPKWSEQERARKANLAGAEEEFKNVNTAETGKALDDQREATAEQKRLLGAQYDDVITARREGIEQRRTAASEASATKKQQAQSAAFKTLTGGRDVLYRKKGDEIPDGWEFIPIHNPEIGEEYEAYAPSAIATVPKELVPYIPGAQEGGQVPRQQLDAALKTYRSELEKRNVQDNKPEKEVSSPDQVLLNPGNYTDAQQKTAHELFDKAHRPPAGNDISALLGANSDAVDIAAAKYEQTGVMPPLGRGGVGQVLILKRVAERQKAAGISPEQTGVNTALFKANQTALTDITKREAQVGTMERTAGKNLDVFLGEAKKLSDTQSPILNQVFRGATRSLTGGLGGFDAARVTAYTEISRVLSGSMSGVLSDSARHEAEHVLNGNYTTADLVKAAAVIRKDMRNRMDSFAEEKRRLAEAMGPQTNTPQAPSTPPAGGPKVGDAQQHNGDTYNFDGQQWVKQFKPTGGRGGR